MRKIAELQAHPQNYRNHPDAQIEAIGKSLSKLGQYRPIIIRPDGTILAGHGVVAAAERLGWSEVEVTVFEGTDEQAKQLLVADNELSRMADDNTDVLISLLQEMEDVSAVGWSDDELAALLEMPELDEFDKVDPDDMEFNHTCPKCGFEWSEEDD